MNHFLHHLITRTLKRYYRRHPEQMGKGFRRIKKVREVEIIPVNQVHGFTFLLVAVMLSSCSSSSIKTYSHPYVDYNDLRKSEQRIKERFGIDHAAYSYDFKSHLEFPYLENWVYNDFPEYPSESLEYEVPFWRLAPGIVYRLGVHYELTGKMNNGLPVQLLNRDSLGNTTLVSYKTININDSSNYGECLLTGTGVENRICFGASTAIELHRESTLSQDQLDSIRSAIEIIEETRRYKVNYDDSIQRVQNTYKVGIKSVQISPKNKEVKAIVKIH